MNKLYSVLTCIFGDYEDVREVVNPSPLAEYILVTDNKNLTSDTWDIVYFDKPFSMNPATMSVYVKYHPFDFVNTNTMIWLDGSVNILDDFSQELMFEFIGCNKDISEVVNIIQGSARNEINRWKIGWGDENNPSPFYGVSTCDNVLRFFDEQKYEMQDAQGMVQTTIYMCKNTQFANNINNITWQLMLQLGVDNEAAREYMSIRSFVINTYTNPINNVMILSPTILWCKYFDYCFHKSNDSQKNSFANCTVNFPENYKDLEKCPFKFNNDWIVPKILPY